MNVKRNKLLTGVAWAFGGALLAGLALFSVTACQAQTSAPPTGNPVRVQRPKPPVPEEPMPAQAPSPSEPPDDQAVLPGDWAPELLYGIISSPNEDAHEALDQAAFAAGSSIIPQLQAALKDDRTAEFAAQALAYIGGPKAFELLTGLLNDRRRLDLRRFYYGALAEFQVPEAGNLLLDAVDRAGTEPDRTVTEAAILALTVHSDSSLVPRLRQAQAKVQDPVIRDDLENAASVIQDRGRYLASSQSRNAEGSLQQAVRAYFMPALEAAGVDLSTSEGSSLRSGKSSAARLPPHQSYTGQPASERTRAARPHEQQPPVRVEIRNLTFSPEKTRALAHVSFEDPSAVAYYDMVLQKRAGDWVLASVWLGPEVEKRLPTKSGP
jgi:hypothetical protein